jgi:alpha-tubulin suppressor-like RCC1 family protein
MSGVGQAVFMNQRSFVLPPVNTVAPVVTGTAVLGEPLSVSDGTWTGTSPITFAYQWQRGTTNISGATASTYTLVSADVGSTIRCVVTATNAADSVSANSANTATVADSRGLWAWGQQFNGGQLGLNVGGNFDSPQQVGALTNWSTVSGDYHTLAAKSDGTLWAWGRGTSGQLGDGTLETKSSPVQIGALTTWSVVSAGNGHSFARKTDSTIWGWGSSGDGQLGQGNTINRSSPVQIGALTVWATVAASVRGGFAIRTAGSLWAWGSSQGVGLLGLGGNYDQRSSPVQVGALTNWSKISAFNSAVAIKTDGTMWTWGRGTEGQLGHNNTFNLNSPVQVGTLTNWANATTNRFQCLAVKTDGTLWAWGYNASGRLGLNDVARRSSPVQVGALTNWSSVSTGQSHCIARKTDGTIWSWGGNSGGRLGRSGGDVSSPTQIGSATNWSFVTAGYQTGFGIRT